MLADANMKVKNGSLQGILHDDPPSHPVLDIREAGGIWNNLPEFTFFYIMPHMSDIPPSWVRRMMRRRLL